MIDQTQAIASVNGAPAPAIIEQVITAGDLAKLSPQQRANYYGNVCQSLGLNPYTRPFEYISLNGKLTLYARKDATDQLRSLRKVSIEIVSRDTVGGLYVVTARASLPDGRTDEEIGAVSVAGLNGEALANAMMKASTKAKRRVTLSVCGLGWLDESEADSIPDARHVRVDVETGEIQEQPALPQPPDAPKAMLEAARDLFREARDAGIPVEPPAAKDSNTLVTWSADVRHRLEVHRSANQGDPDDVEAAQGAADELDKTLEEHAATKAGQPSWFGRPLGAKVMEMVDQLTAAGAKFSLPPDDADDATLSGWLSSKAPILKARQALK